MQDKHECPACKGKGTQTIKTTHVNFDGHGGVKKSETEMTCFWCKGEKTLTDEQLAFWKSCQEVWCKCGNPSGNKNYYEEDGSHGWDCADCGKLLQTG